MTIAAIRNFRLSDRAQLFIMIALGSLAFGALLCCVVALWLRLGRGFPQTGTPEKLLWLLPDYDGFASLTAMAVTLAAAAFCALLVSFWVYDLQDNKSYLENGSRTFRIISGRLLYIVIGSFATLALAYWQYMPSFTLLRQTATFGTNTDLVWIVSYGAGNISAAVILIVCALAPASLVWETISDDRESLSDRQVD